VKSGVKLGVKSGEKSRVKSGVMSDFIMLHLMSPTTPVGNGLTVIVVLELGKKTYKKQKKFYKLRRGDFQHSLIIQKPFSILRQIQVVCLIRQTEASGQE
jgi:hypothetical protein